MRRLLWMATFSLVLMRLGSSGVLGAPLSMEGMYIATPAELDQAAVFSFAIISDNKGLGPSDSVLMSRADRWIREMDAQAIIGMGDHLKRGRANTFLALIREDDLWRGRFWPNIADGENEYYGEGQGDWGAGRGLVDEAGLREREGVAIRENGCEYYARIPVAGCTIHLIQLHYSDRPLDPSVAFTADTRQYLRDTLESIDKGPGDIIICGAHSLFGNWLPVLSPELRELVLSKADLVLSATTHRFARLDHGPDRALCVNTGSCGYASGGNGFVSVHVLPEMRLVVQYVSTDAEERRLAAPAKAFIKTLGGATASVRFVVE